MKNLLQKSELNRKLRNFITLCFVCLLAIGNAWGQGQDLVLTFDLSSNPGTWPTTNSTTLTEYTYDLDGTYYTFALKNVKCNIGYLMLTQTAALGLPAVEDYKLTKVVAKNSGGCSTSVNVGVSSSASSASYISGGAKLTWATTSSSYIYNLSGTSDNTVYYLYVTDKNAQITSLELTYEYGSTTPTVSAPEYSKISDWKAVFSTTSTVTSKLTGDLTFVYNNGKYFYFQDAAGTGLLVYDGNNMITREYNNGDVVSGGVYGTCTIYNGLYELVPTQDFPAGVAGTEVQPEEVTAAQITSDFATYESKLVKIVGVTFDGNYTFNNNNRSTTFTQGQTNLTCYNNFKTLAKTVVGGEHADVVGFVGCYNATKQIFPRDDNDILIWSTVATPSITPATTSFATSQTVSISCETEDAIIYYTTDGEDPTVNSLEYFEPFSVSATTTVKAMAVKAGYENSAVATATYTLEELYTVTLPDQTLTETSFGAGVTLPSLDNVGDFTFSGWSTDYYAEEITTQPTIISAGEYHPTGDITLYPIYTHSENGGIQWRKITDLSSITAGTYALLTTDGHAFNGTIKKGHGQVTTESFSFTDNVASTAPTGTCEIELQAVNGGYKMYNSDLGYLYASAASSGKLAWYNSEGSYWFFGSNNWKYNANGAYLRSYSNSSIRTYGANNGEVLVFAKKELAEVTYYTSVLPRYNVYIDMEGVTNGIVFSDKVAARPGEMVSLTVTPDVGYSFDLLVIKDNPLPGEVDEIVPTKVGQSYQFVMPASDVTVMSEFYETPHTVYFVEGNGVAEHASIRERRLGEGIILPEAEPCAYCTDWIFWGWSENFVNATPNEPSNILYENSSYLFTSNKVLYAVYRDGDMFSSNPDCYTITSGMLPLTVDFESYTTSTEKKTGIKPTCWSLVHEYANMVDTVKPQLYYDNNMAHSGNYSLYLHAKGTFAMPKIEPDINTLTLSLYIAQTRTMDQLIVGVMDDLADESSFVPVRTIDNLTTHTPQYYEIDFSGYTGNGHYIAFRNVVAPGFSYGRSYSFIDDITLSVAPIVEACDGITIPYTEDFENYTVNTMSLTGAQPTCWTLGHADVAMTFANEPQVSYGSENAHGGDYSLYMSKRCIYVMPEIINADVKTLTMNFYVKQVKYVQRLEVGVMTDPTDVTTFENVATIYNNGNYTTPQLHSVDFADYTGNGRYIAFRNILTTGTDSYSKNYIDDISIDITPVPEACAGITIPYTEGFESYTVNTMSLTGAQPTCWTLGHADVAMPSTEEPQVSYGSENAHDSNYSLYMSKRGIYVMPEITNADINALTMSFYVKQVKYVQRLEVGVMTDPTDENSFTSVSTIYNNGEYTTAQLHTINFAEYSGNGHYIAFRNILSSGTGTYSKNYIDDISLDFTPEPIECSGIRVPYNESFETYTVNTMSLTGVQPLCWTLAQSYVSMTYAEEPQVSYGNADDGDYSLFMGKRSLYVMPEITNVDVCNIKMNLSVKQRKYAHRLVIGVMTDPADESTFVGVKTLNITSDYDNYHSYEVNFSNYIGNGRYIAFKNIVTNTDKKSENYIDDITLSIATPETRLAENEQAGEDVETVEETEETASYDNEDNFSLLTREPEVTVYPNPTTGNLHFAAMENVEKVEVYNNIGRLVATFNNQREINISDMPAGLYMLRVTLQGDAVVMKKVVKK